MPAKSHNLCPVCGKSLAADQINLAEGVALCSGCGGLSRLSDVAGAKRPITETLSQTPNGCWIRDWGAEFVVHATLRSLGGTLISLVFTLFWNGLLSVFVLVALQGLYTNLVGPVPAWFPGPQMQDPMSLGTAIFLCVFLLPFVVVGSMFAGVTLLCAAGKVEVKLSAIEGQVRTGIGPFVWRRRFNPAQVTRIRLGTIPRSEGRPSEAIVIEADRTVQFGSMLSDQRRQWMRAALQVLLLMPSSRERQQLLSTAGRHFDDWGLPAEEQDA